MKLILVFFICCSPLLLSAKKRGNDTCNVSPIPSIQFSKNSILLSKTAKVVLDSMVGVVNDEKWLYKLKVMGYSELSEAGQQIGWDRVRAVTDYLISKGVSADKLIFNYSCENGSTRIVTLIRSLPGEDGPSMVAAPHPCLSYHLPKSKRCKHLH